MKHFLPLLILTGLLLGQDVLNLKSGESFDGTFYGKVGEDIVFKVEGETSTKKFPIWSVETIVTKNGELTYPFDIPIKQEYPFDTPTKQDYPRTGIRRSNSYGFFSEKMPFSFFDFSLSENIGGHSEFYGTFSYLFFGGGFGIGYKHYFINKSKYLGYVSANISKNLWGDGSVTADFTTFSIGTGGRLFRNEKTTSFGFTVKSYLNIGISIYYVLSANKHMNMHENEIGVVPFINLEKRW